MTQQTQQTNGRTTEANEAATLKSKVDAILDNTVTYRPFMGDADISLTPRTIMGYFAKPTRQGHMPTPQQAAKFVMLCKARALNPWEGDAFIVGYDTNDGPEFNLITAHQAFLKRAEVHPEYDGMESGATVKLPDGTIVDQQGDFFDEGQAIVGGWARVYFKTRKIPTYRRVKLSTFNTGRSRWQKDPAGMIVKVAEADALRSSFPTKLGGMYLREEFDATAHEAQAKTPVAMPRAIEVPDKIPPSAEPIIKATEQPDEQPPLADGEIPNEPDPPQEPEQPKLSAAVADLVLKLNPEKELSMQEFNEIVPGLIKGLKGDDKKIGWDIVVKHAAKFDLVFDKKTKTFVSAEQPNEATTF